ncbi:YkgJ family cysteine cluster protein [Kineococcus sp. NBC_00420]|uniref:YkgJ family cysteine cluster protein n=1 Tax=Kineococcus sp. NBC_00420 TaxID=2903564 RepID=UPI002E1DC0C6
MSPRRTAPVRREFSKATEWLEQLSVQLPALSCLGLCEDFCSKDIDASITERRRLLAAGVDLDDPTPDGACPALSRTFGAGRCSVYAIRPTICRLWGATESMPCPHGCRPEGGLVDDATAMRWMITSLQIGNHLDDPAVQELLELALTDQAAASLLSRFLRGDRAITTQLYERMIQLRARRPARSEQALLRRQRQLEEEDIGGLGVHTGARTFN